MTKVQPFTLPPLPMRRTRWRRHCREDDELPSGKHHKKYGETLNE